MKFEALVDELKTQVSQKIDLIAPVQRISMYERKGAVELAVDNEGGACTFDRITPSCHRQIAQKLGIDGRYYSRCLEQKPDLLAKNVNGWLEWMSESWERVRNQAHRLIAPGVEDINNFLIRGLGTKARAFLSDRFKIMDNMDILEIVLSEIEKNYSDTHTGRCYMSDDKLFVELLNNKARSYIKDVGDIVVGGLTIENSETGHGKSRLILHVNQMVCSNRLLTGFKVELVHRGGRIDNEFLRSRGTELAESRLFQEQIRAGVANLMDERKFEGVVEKMRFAAKQEVPNVKKAVDNIVNKFGMSEEDREGVLGRFIAMDSDRTRYNVINAVTNYAQEFTKKDELRFEKRIEFEKIGGELLNMSNSGWERLVNGGEEYKN